MKSCFIPLHHFFLLTFLLPSALCLLPSSSPAQTYSVSGTVNYANVHHSTIDSTSVYLIQNDSILAIDTTDDYGNYSFGNVSPGIYLLQVTSNQMAQGWGSTDALAILKHFVGLSLLTGMNLIVADNSADGFVNSIDALHNARRFVGQINSFPSGDWYFETVTVEITNSSVIQHIRGLCFGDVNGSFVPLNSHPGK
ncbi:MAG: hypothetical protein NTU44_14110 [Bacteroidetes bacterium]|nr:hypothetical protein [Bacteroidota bacterium]